LLRGKKHLFVGIAADDEGLCAGEGGGDGIEGMVGQEAAIDDRSETTSGAA
jgi:hypothetical protein